MAAMARANGVSSPDAKVIWLRVRALRCAPGRVVFGCSLLSGGQVMIDRVCQSRMVVR